MKKLWEFLKRLWRENIIDRAPDEPHDFPPTFTGGGYMDNEARPLFGMDIGSGTIKQLTPEEAKKFRDNVEKSKHDAFVIVDPAPEEVKKIVKAITKNVRRGLDKHKKLAYIKSPKRKAGNRASKNRKKRARKGHGRRAR